MRIRSLTLRNFRGFEDATIDLDRPLTVLCGVNGSGKSSVLMACVFVLSRVLSEVIPRSQLPADQSSWRHIPDRTDIRRGELTCAIEATISNGDVTQRVILADSGPQLLVVVDGDQRGRLHVAGRELSVFYQSSREVATARDAFSLRTNGSHETAEDPMSALHDSLVAGHLKFRSFFQWFKAREDVENELKVSKGDLALEDLQLTAVRRAVAGMLPGFSGLRIQRDPLHMVIHKDATELFVDQLSDGEKLLLVLTADLARRLAMVYVGYDNPLTGEAVVLIDEIEQHLHPSWQRTVVQSLRDTFPNCQFIITTHSPQVLSEVPNEAVVLVQDFQFFRPAAPTEGRDSNAILWEVLGVEARPHEVVQEIEVISGLLDEHKDGEARERLDRLAQALTERDTEVARLRSLLDVAERIDASNPQGA